MTFLQSTSQDMGPVFWCERLWHWVRVQGLQPSTPVKVCVKNPLLPGIHSPLRKKLKKIFSLFSASAICPVRDCGGSPCRSFETQDRCIYVGQTTMNWFNAKNLCDHLKMSMLQVSKAHTTWFEE